MADYISGSGRRYKSFKKSSWSTGGANCVEVGVADDGTRALRDSKNPSGPAIEVGATEFSEFLSGVRSGEFDRPQ